MTRAHNELAQREAGLLPGEEGVVQEDLLYPGLALTERRTCDKQRMTLLSNEFIQYYSPDMRRQLMAKLTGNRWSCFWLAY